MSVLDISSKILLAVQADTSQARAELKNLEGAEREAAKASIEAAEAKNKSLDSYVEKLGHVGLALSTVTQVVGFAEDSLKAYADNLRLEAAAGAIDVDHLSDAFQGLIDKHDLLQFAAKTAHGVLKLNQDQMETLAQASIALGRAGFDQAEAMEALEESAVSGKTRRLHELGLTVKEGATPQETLNNLMAESNRLIKESSDLLPTEAERVQRTSVAWANFKESVEEGTAQIFLSLPPLEDMAKQLKEIDKYWTHDHVGELTGDNTVDLGFNYDEILDGPKPTEDTWGTAKTEIDTANLTKSVVALDKFAKKFDERTEATKRAQEAAKHAAEEAAKLKKQMDADVAMYGAGFLVGDLKGGTAIQEGIDSADIHNMGITGMLANKGESFRLPAPDTSDLDAAMDKLVAKAKGETLMEQLFGKHEDLSAYQIGLKAIGETLNGLASSAATGLDAMILGSQSGAKAFTQSIGQMLHGLAVKEITQGMVETGEGIASLFIDPPAAPGHFAAAATYDAIGVAADLAARGLGFSGASGSTGSAGSSGGSSGTTASNTLSVASSGDSTAAQTTNIFVVGDPSGAVTGSSPRMQQANFQRIQQLVSGTTGVAFK